MQTDKKGFTLIEVLVVVAILGILVTFVATRFMGEPEKARINQVKIQMQTLEDALKLYKLENFEYPSTEQGLKALVEKPVVGNIPKNWKEGGYLEKGRMPKDPWGNDYIYINPGTHNPNSVDIFSYGPDGPGGDQSKMIGNWESETQEQTQ
jgi:general secretion pathway protein G